MMIDSDTVISTVGLTAMVFWYLGGYKEYAKKEGTYELRRALRAEFRENERLREELYNAGVALGAERHPASRALPQLSVQVERPHLSVVGEKNS